MKYITQRIPLDLGPLSTCEEKRFEVGQYVQVTCLTGELHILVAGNDTPLEYHVALDNHPQTTDLLCLRTIFSARRIKKGWLWIKPMCKKALL